MTYETDPILTTVKERAINIILNKLAILKKEMKLANAQYDNTLDSSDLQHVCRTWGEIEACKALIKQFEEELGD